MKTLNEKGIVDHIVIIAMVVVVAVGGFVLWRVLGAEDAKTETSENSSTEESTKDEDSSSQDASEDDADTDSNEVDVDEEAVIPEGWRTYDSELGYSLAYPSEWEQRAANGTASFGPDLATGGGLSVYVWVGATKDSNCKQTDKEVIDLTVGPDMLPAQQYEGGMQTNLVVTCVERGEQVFYFVNSYLRTNTIETEYEQILETIQFTE